MTWEPVIGLEIHIHLKTRTKMFCRCQLEYGADENSRTCPVCLAHPGTLPVPNVRAIEMTILLGHALQCEIAPHSVFHRKHYFYPDLPKGYQISQYDQPLCVSGRKTGETKVCRPLSRAVIVIRKRSGAYDQDRYLRRHDAEAKTWKE